LFKQEPTCYSFGELQRDGKTVWDGVSNPLARQHLRQVREGDRVLFYATGKEKCILGEMRVVGAPRPDPTSEDPKAVVVDVEPVRAFERPIMLAEVKGDPALSDWDLVRLPRLSVMPVTEVQWQRIEELARTKR